MVGVERQTVARKHRRQAENPDRLGGGEGIVVEVKEDVHGVRGRVEEEEKPGNLSMWWGGVGRDELGRGGGWGVRGVRGGYGGGQAGWEGVRQG